MARTTYTRKTREQRAAEAAELADRLKAFRDSLDEDEIVEYLERFDGYSERNALLIVMQRPEATVVHGFHQWPDHGRKVRKGATGIQILAPAGFAEATPAAEGEKAEQPKMRFRKAYVFDIDDTEPLTAAQPAAA